MRQEAVQETLARCVAELSACLTDQGTRDLRETRLTEMEDEVCGVAEGIATAGASVALHRADTGKLHRVLYNTLQRPASVSIYGMAFSHDGKLLAIAKNGEHDVLVKGETMFDHGVTLWDVREILKPIK